MNAPLLDKLLRFYFSEKIRQEKSVEDVMLIIDYHEKKYNGSKSITRKKDTARVIFNYFSDHGHSLKLIQRLRDDKRKNKN